MHSHYNYFRDYDPGIGRYVQSDPIGLGGGLNTYSYVENDPLNWTDPEGLAKGRGGLSKGCSRLRSNVEIFCKFADRRCEECDDCSTLIGKVGIKRACIFAQHTLTKMCYARNPTHRQRIDDMKRGIATCMSIGAGKECAFGDMGDLSNLEW